MREQKSIVLVTVDCLRADHVGFMGYQRPTTPFLDSLANESFVFPAAIVGGAPTYYSLPAIMASRYPLALGRDVLGLAPDEPSFASVLHHLGYSTAAFSAANPYISARFGYEHGFDVFRDFLSDQSALSEEKNVTVSANSWASRLNRKIQSVRSMLGPLGSLYDEIYFRYCQRVTPSAKSLDGLRRFPAADVIVDQACSWLSSVGTTPFFLWLHLMDPHSPYYPTGQALDLIGCDPVTPIRALYLNSYWNRSDVAARRLFQHRDNIVWLYDAGIRWVDAQIARLTESLRASKQWDKCIFALTADHGEEFLDHGGRYHPPSGLMEELIHVPLLVRVPGAAKREVSKSPFSLLHLAPTLLEAAGATVPDTFVGQSHWKQMREGHHPDEVAIAECVAGCTNPFRREHRFGHRVLVVRDARFKLVLHFDAESGRLYDLEADPGEQNPLPVSAEKIARHRLLEHAREHLQKSSDERHSDSRLRACLRELQLEWKTSRDKASATAS